MNYKTQEEGAACVDEVVDFLADANNEESGAFNLPLDVNREAFKSPAFNIFTLRDEENVLVGYAAFVVGNHPHYQTKVFAFNDVVYVHPAHRKASRSFMDTVVDLLEVDVVSFCMPYDSPHVELMEKLGFAPVEITYYKVK